MGKKSFLLLIAVFSSVSIINGAAIDNLEINLEKKLSEIIEEVNSNDTRYKYNVIKQKDNHIAGLKTRVQKENETLLNDLSNFINGKVVLKIQDKSRECLELAVSYKRYKNTAFTFYKDCLVNQLNMVETKCDIVQHKPYRFLNELYSTKAQLSSCLELKKTNSSKASTCLAKLTEKVNEFQQVYEVKMFRHNVPFLKTPPFEKCDNLYNGRSRQLNNQLKKCLE
ncbi:uncharacterized protein LOC122504023 [Leptopilina heterotoma]|uniref:uncharacterized protein LOC122504023 n=1 Tax=Leptopilina heterotoma TaxID=63436 RepID=UPI001CA9D4FC|nr:uncharacterized protein LOC122504023 [Leptopilina heterotoma]